MWTCFLIPVTVWLCKVLIVPGTKESRNVWRFHWIDPSLDEITFKMSQLETIRIAQNQAQWVVTRSLQNNTKAHLNLWTHLVVKLSQSCQTMDTQQKRWILVILWSHILQLGVLVCCDFISRVNSCDSGGKWRTCCRWTPKGLLHCRDPFDSCGCWLRFGRPIGFHRWLGMCQTMPERSWQYSISRYGLRVFRATT